MNASNELSRAERLRHVVVGPHPKTDEHVRLGISRRQHQHRDGSVFLDPAANLQAIESREHEVENDEIGFQAFASCHGRRTVSDNLDLETLLPKPSRHRSSDSGLILNDQQSPFPHKRSVEM
jgi:hypothetical protein